MAAKSVKMMRVIVLAGKDKDEHDKVNSKCANSRDYR